ncbi:hypothetical protein NFI96_021683 [Prochilodus magdalenae]|nr:hypothetical protein NFI96_021683 [Prochilodus magdalenae]
MWFIYRLFTVLSYLPLSTGLYLNTSDQITFVLPRYILSQERFSSEDSSTKATYEQVSLYSGAAHHHPRVCYVILKEERSGEKAAEARAVKLYGQIPPVEKMDASLSTLINCEKLSLSTNCIEKIANLNGLKNLKILSLGRNNIKNLNGLEAVGDTLEELWISYNLIDKLKGIHVMKRLRVLYMSNNLVKEWGEHVIGHSGRGEFVKLADLPSLVDLVFVGNPLEEKYSAEGTWIDEATKRVPNLKKLDGMEQTPRSFFRLTNTTQKQHASPAGSRGGGGFHGETPQTFELHVFISGVVWGNKTQKYSEPEPELAETRYRVPPQLYRELSYRPLSL